ncbi:MAG: sigma-70 family RNA polymerase sigma factor [Acidobacteria bacterium]|nr:sigma-70 family RNA polymerase sigma factor [Acidobacteriota bacterium]
MTDDRPITELLRALEGDDQAADQLFRLVYDELRWLASSRLRGERPGHTLRTTDLVHEAYLRLAGGIQVEWENRRQFFAIVAKAMRRVLVDHARHHAAGKRIHPQLMIPLDAVEPASGQPVDVVDLDLALDRLAALDARQARIVELLAFVGLTQDEAAELLDISPATVYREWRVAKLWLKAELREAREGS